MANTSLSGARVAPELKALIVSRGKPGMIVIDNVLCREAAAGFGQQNPFVESFSVRLQGKFLNETPFSTRRQTCAPI